MKNPEELVIILEENAASILSHTHQGKDIWSELLSMHPAEVAATFGYLKQELFLEFFKLLPHEFSTEVFEKLSVDRQVDLVQGLERPRIEELLNGIHSDKLIAIFEYLPERDLQRYLKLTNRRRRNGILASLEFKPSSAGRILNSDVLTLHAEFSIKKCITILQGLIKDLEILPHVFVINAQHKLMGYIDLADLVRNAPMKKVAEILKEVEVVINAKDDAEDIARVFRQYDSLVLPVVDDGGHFLGIISANDILDVVQSEMTEDSFKMSGLTTSPRTYLETPFFTIVYGRVLWLVPLLLFQSISTLFQIKFKPVLDWNRILWPFLTTLIGTGGNVGNQCSTLVIRGLVTGEFNFKNRIAILLREIRVSIFTGAILALVVVLRMIIESPGTGIKPMLTIAGALFSVVLCSTFLGTVIPMLFDRLKIDPANAAAPFIATLMDIVGVMIYCSIAGLIGYYL